MARFFRTSGAMPIDFMSRLNTPLMEAVISKNDQYITESLQGAAQLGQAASSFGFLTQDKDRAEKIMNEYNTKIEGVTQAILKDPANWRSQEEGLRTLSRDLVKNYKTGEISKIAGNHAKYKAVSDYIDKQVEQFNKDGKGISADRANKYKEFFLRNFKGTFNEDGTANQINTFNPMNDIDIRKRLSEEMDKMKADGSIRITDEVSGNGEYFNKQTNEWEAITPERILRIATDRLNNPEIMNYLKQDTMAGVVTGVFDTNPGSPNYGKFIAPYNYKSVQRTALEQQTIDRITKQIDQTKDKNTKELYKKQLDSYVNSLDSRKELEWDERSMLAPILRGITSQYSFQKTKQENDLSANPVWDTKFTQANLNNRQAKELEQEMRMQDKLFQQQKDLQTQKLEMDKELKMLDVNTKLAVAGMKGTGKAGAGSETKTSNNIIASAYTTPFAWATESPDKMVYTLSEEINTTNHTLSQLEKALGDVTKASPDNKLLIGNIKNQIESTKAVQQSLEDRRNNAFDFALNEWKAKGQSRRGGVLDKMFGTPPVNYSESNEKLAREYISGKLESDVQAANSEFQKVQAGLKNFEEGTPEYNTYLRNVYNPARAKVGNAQSLLAGGQRVFNNEIKPHMDTKLVKAAQETTNRSDVVATTTEQDKMVFDMVSAAPSNYKILDKQGKETNLSFEHGTAGTNFKINGVATTTGLGDKGIQVLATINGQNVIIVPKDDKQIMQSYFANQFMTNKEDNVKNIGRILSSPTAGLINDMLTEIRMNTSSAVGTKDSWTYRTIPNPSNPNDMIRIRARSVSTGAGEPKWEFQFETNDLNEITRNRGNNSLMIDGKDVKGFVPLRSTNNELGVYHNLTDILKLFPANK